MSCRGLVGYAQDADLSTKRKGQPQQGSKECLEWRGTRLRAINMNRFAFLEADSVGRISGTADSCILVRELLY